MITASTELAGGELKEVDQVIVGVTQPGAARQRRECARIEAHAVRTREVLLQRRSIRLEQIRGLFEPYADRYPHTELLTGMSHTVDSRRSTTLRKGRVEKRDGSGKAGLSVSVSRVRTQRSICLLLSRHFANYPSNPQPNSFSRRICISALLSPTPMLAKVSASARCSARAAP